MILFLFSQNLIIHEDNILEYTDKNYAAKGRGGVGEMLTMADERGRVVGEMLTMADEGGRMVGEMLTMADEVGRVVGKMLTMADEGGRGV